MQKPLLPEAFAEMAADFCSRHSFDKAPVAPKIGGGSGPSASATASASGGGGIMSSSSGGGSGGSGARMVSNQSSVGEMTEEQQLQAAIRASMNDAAGAGSGSGTGANDYQPYDDDDNDDESVEYIMPDDDSDAECSMEDNEVQIMDSGTSAREAKPEPKEPSFMEQIIAMDVGEEPSDKAARVMIRMPDGKRLVRRFKMDDTVKIIYAFVAQSSEDAKGGKEFVIKAGFPPKDLLWSVDESIATSGLAGDSITVRWMED